MDDTCRLAPKTVERLLRGVADHAASGGVALKRDILMRATCRSARLTPGSRELPPQSLSPLSLARTPKLDMRAHKIHFPRAGTAARCRGRKFRAQRDGKRLRLHLPASRELDLRRTARRCEQNVRALLISADGHLYSACRHAADVSRSNVFDGAAGSISQFLNSILFRNAGMKFLASYPAYSGDRIQCAISRRGKPKPLL